MRKVLILIFTAFAGFLNASPIDSSNIDTIHVATFETNLPKGKILAVWVSSNVRGEVYVDKGDGILLPIGVIPEHYTKTEVKTEDSKVIKFFTLKNNAPLTGIDCSNSGISKIDVSNNHKLQTLNCSNNNLKQIDLTKNSELTNLILNNNQLTELDISKNTLLMYLECVNNKLKNLDVSNNHRLITLLTINSKL